MKNKLLRKFFLAFFSLLSFTWLVIEYLIIGIFDTNPIKGTGPFGLLSIVFISAFISLLFVNLIEINKNESPKKDELKKDKEFLNSLINGIMDSYEDENWEEVIKIGSVLSRPLWITGRYKLRIKLGGLVESSAAHIGHPLEQAQALIDDLGWTNFEVGNVSVAKRNIEHGIKVAMQISPKKGIV